MNPVLAVFLTVLLGSSMYLAGRLHARVGYRFGYRYGYRQGYFDGDRACWNRIRRDTHTGYVLEAAPAAQSSASQSSAAQSSAKAGVQVPAPRQYSVTEDEPGSFSMMHGERVRVELPDRDGDVPGTTYASSAALGRHAQDDYVSG